MGLPLKSACGEQHEHETREFKAKKTKTSGISKCRLV